MERRPVLPNLKSQKLSLECASCGYGIVRSAPPERCPMCRQEGRWVHSPRRPWSRGRHPVV